MVLGGKIRPEARSLVGQPYGSTRRGTGFRGSGFESGEVIGESLWWMCGTRILLKVSSQSIFLHFFLSIVTATKRPLSGKYSGSLMVNSQQ